MYESFEELIASIKDCRKCKLCNSRKNIVFDDGDINADITSPRVSAKEAPLLIVDIAFVVCKRTN